ncbi:MAG TPA: T9SS type A sorting domain-containing protein, partial [Cytophaga sp.]|nr:T9SS type A sorting domain-containing protein [Cytophaga sp.]
DNDGKGDPNIRQTACAKPNGYVAIAGGACPADVNKITPGNCGCGNTEQRCVDCAGIANGTAALDVCNICSGGTTGITPKVNLSKCTATAVTNPIGLELISIYPNPFENDFTIDTKGILINFYIYDSSGSLVETVLLDSETQIGAQLKSGIYLVRYNMHSNWSQFKIIKM